jgi:hypothetical protein
MSIRAMLVNGIVIGRIYENGDEPFVMSFNEAWKLAVETAKTCRVNLRYGQGKFNLDAFSGGSKFTAVAL